MNYYFIDYENTGENGLSGIKQLDENSTVIIFYSQNNGRLSFDMHKMLCCAKANLEYRKVDTATKNALDFQLSSYLGYLISQNSEDNFYIISKDNGYHAVLSFWQGKNIRQVHSISASLAKMRQEQPPVQEAEVVADIRSVAQDAPRAEPEKQEAEMPEQEAQTPEQQPDAKEQPKPAKRRRTTKVVVKKQATNKKKKVAEPQTEGETDLKTKILQLIEESEIAENVALLVAHYKTKQGVNNAIVKAYGTEKRGEIYKKIKPLLKDKKGN